tara:strand:+ start:1266 stop:1967 length:702 start_codon:yes stop_codon:yes gene_type:complete
MIDLDKGDTRLIIDACKKRGLLRNQCAYVLATAYWETARTMKPINEAGGPVYFKRMYDITGNRPDVARRLGNMQPGDGVKFAGRGYVQITGRDNYLRAGQKLGISLVSRPDDALRSEYAAPILVMGMAEGWFTGKKLSDYITLQRSGFVNARRIINGKDRAGEIAAIARDYDKALKAAGYGVKAEDPHLAPLPPERPPAPSAPPPGAPPGVNQSFWKHLAAFIGRLFRMRRKS